MTNNIKIYSITLIIREMQIRTSYPLQWLLPKKGKKWGGGGAEVIQAHVHSSIIHHKKMKIIQVFISKLMDKQNVMYTYKGPLFSQMK